MPPMGTEDFSAYRHEAVHELIRLNDLCEEEFRISSWPRWFYDLDRGTLTFSKDGQPKVVASIQVIGSTSVSGGTWMWAWANESLPPNVTHGSAKVREFGRANDISDLTESELRDDEHLGWEMTAIAAKLLGAKGAYRFPGDNGFLYVVYSSIGFVAEESPNTDSKSRVECSEHGTGFRTYVCEHLIANPAQEWFSREPDEENKWPDSWCGGCDVYFQEQGEWNDRNQLISKIKILCHHCYEKLRSMGTFSEPEA